MATLTPPPRHDFFQTPHNLTVSLYVKGYAGTPVSVCYHTHHVDVSLPAIPGADAAEFSVGPLAGAIIPGECSERVLGTKVSLAPLHPSTSFGVARSSHDCTLRRRPAPARPRPIGRH
jgi:suppressor of G2 allele of SKP1